MRASIARANAAGFNAAPASTRALANLIDLEPDEPHRLDELATAPASTGARA